LLEKQALTRSRRAVRQQLRDKFDLREIVYDSDAMHEVLVTATQVAPADVPVLITGPNGVGKEVLADIIHANSACADGALVKVNVGALPGELMESELFGAEAGAYTGATKGRQGRFEAAAGGTLFLDEIGNLSLAGQAKLLRVLQTGEFERLGSSVTRRVRVRVLSATNADLRAAIREGRFREDLFYRLNVVAVAMPALRDRREDIPLLAAHLLQKHARTSARRITMVSSEALSCLMAYDWPGNVRELENVIERAIVLGTTEQILPDDLPESIVESRVEPSASGAKFHEMIREIKKQLVGRALKDAGGSYGEAAKILGLHPNNLHRLMKTLGMKTKE
jgi:DNA-binding NtrC family response regulator